jgi:hypothetical protein
MVHGARFASLGLSNLGLGDLSLGRTPRVCLRMTPSTSPSSMREPGAGSIRPDAWLDHGRLCQRPILLEILAKSRTLSIEEEGQKISPARA